MDKYTCFKILDPDAKIPEGYQFIKLLWTFDVKFDGRKHARLVGGGHMTERLNVEDLTSSMIQVDSIRLGFIAADMMDLDILAGDINSDYIQAYTKEKIYTIAGPEFGPLQGRILIIVKALYGL